MSHNKRKREENNSTTKDCHSGRCESDDELDLDALLQEMDNESDHDENIIQKSKKENKKDEESQEHHVIIKNQKYDSYEKMQSKIILNNKEKNSKEKDNNDDNDQKNKRQKQENIIAKKEENKHNNEKKEINFNNDISPLLKFINLSWMKRMDQYIQGLEKKEIPFHLTEEFLTMLDPFDTVDDIIIQSNRNDLKMALIARYQLYLWLKRNNLFIENNDDITKENITLFKKWLN